MGFRSRAVSAIAALITLAGCSDEPSPPPSAPAPVEAAPSPQTTVDPTPLKRAYAVAAGRERAAVQAVDDPDYIRRLRKADAAARAALVRLEAPGGRTHERLTKARAAVEQLQGVLRETAE